MGRRRCPLPRFCRESLDHGDVLGSPDCQGAASSLATGELRPGVRGTSRIGGGSRNPDDRLHPRSNSDNVKLDRDGNKSPLRTIFASWLNPAFAPDGRRLCWTISKATSGFDEDDSSQGPGRVFFSRDQTPSNANVMILPMEGNDAAGGKSGKPAPFRSTRFNESEAMFSPDGHWIAYMSNETGHSEVYVRAFPGPGGAWQISSGGGAWPTWSHTKSELFYTDDDIRLMVASYVAEGDSLRPQKPRRYSEARVAPGGVGRLFDLHPDGERFVVAVAAPTRGESTRSDGGSTASRVHLQLLRRAASDRSANEALAKRVGRFIRSRKVPRAT